MALLQKNTVEKAKDASSSKESISRVLGQKQATEKANAAKPVADAIQGEVADVMAGVEGMKEKPAEKAGERGNENKASGTIQGDQAQQAAIFQQLKAQIFPDPEVMIRRIRSRIKQDIEVELKKADKLSSQLSKGSAHEYNAVIARIRNLKHILNQLLTATVDMIKEFYLRFVRTSEK